MTARKRHLILASALAASCALVTVNAHADSVADSEAQFRVGVSLQRGDDFEAAIRAYEASLRLHATRSALFNLANCLKATHRYPEARHAFEQLLGQYGADLDSEMRQAAETQLAALSQLVGTLSIEVLPDGSEIVVDGRPVGRSPLPAPLELAVGRHDLEARLDGYQTERRHVEVDSEHASAEQIILTRSEPPPPRSQPPIVPQEQLPPRPIVQPGAARSDTGVTLGWVATGLGGALLLGGAATGTWALALNGSLEDECQKSHCPADRSRDIDRLDTLATATNVLLGAGGVLAAVGIAVLTISPSAAPRREERTTLHLSAGPTLLSAEFEGRF